MTKTEACRIHIKRRFKERFGLDINRHDIRDLVDDIQKGNNILYAKRLTSRVTAFNMNFKNTRCVVLYDKNRKVPVTVLTPDMEVREDESDWC